MIKYILVVGLSIFTLNAHAHYQKTELIKQTVYSKKAVVKIEVGNLNDITKEFEIEINGHVTKQRVKIQPRKFITVPVKLSIVPNVINHFEICSIIINKNVKIPRTRICTPVKLLFPQSRLQQHYSQQDN